MKKFKQLLQFINEASKAGVAKYQAGLRDIRPVKVEDPGAAFGYRMSTYGQQTAAAAGIENARRRRDEVKAAAEAEGKVKGAERKKRIAAQSKQIARTQKTAKTIGIPDIHSILDGSQGERDVAGVTVVGHEKNGYIAKHQGSIHFKHPDGKTHPNIELRPSANGIAIWAARAGNKKSVKAIAHIQPEGDAIPVRGGVSKGNVFVHPEDDLNR